MGIWAGIKRGWMRFVDVFGRVQTTILLTVVYHLTVGPLSVIARAGGGQFLKLRPPQRNGGPATHLVPLKPITTTMEQAKRQF